MGALSVEGRAKRGGAVSKHLYLCSSRRQLRAGPSLLCILQGLRQVKSSYWGAQCEPQLRYSVLYFVVSPKCSSAWLEAV